MTSGTAPKPVPKQKTPSTGKYYSISFIALLVGIIAIAITFVGWHQQRGSHSSTNDQLEQLSQSLAELKTSFLQFQQQTQNAIEGNQKNITDLMNQTNQSAEQQAILDAGYLIHLAHLHLTVEKNIVLGLHFLKMAQSRLQSLTSTNLLPLKQALDSDIATISSVTKINPAALIAQIDTLSTQIANLPTQPERVINATDQPIKNETTPGESWWDRMKRNLSGLQRLFIIRHVDTPVAPILGPEQMLLLKENIRFKLLQAQWALLHQQSGLYEQSLNSAAELLDTYEQNKPAAAPIVKKIRDLAMIDINPQVPPLQSLKLLNTAPQKQQPVPTDKKENESTLS